MSHTRHLYINFILWYRSNTSHTGTRNLREFYKSPLVVIHGQPSSLIVLPLHTTKPRHYLPFVLVFAPSRSRTLPVSTPNCHHWSSKASCKRRSSQIHRFRSTSRLSKPNWLSGTLADMSTRPNGQRPLLKVERMLLLLYPRNWLPHPPSHQPV